MTAKHESPRLNNVRRTSCGRPHKVRPDKTRTSAKCRPTELEVEKEKEKTPLSFYVAQPPRARARRHT